MAHLCSCQGIFSRWKKCKFCLKTNHFMMYFLKLKCIHLTLEMYTINVIHFFQPLTHRGGLNQTKQANQAPSQPSGNRKVLIVDLFMPTLLIYKILILRGSLIQTYAVILAQCGIFCCLERAQIKALLYRTLLTFRAGWNWQSKKGPRSPTPGRGHIKGIVRIRGATASKLIKPVFFGLVLFL